MAALGFTPISLYYSTTAAAVPVNTDLTNGELAINITDGKLYYKSNSGVVTLLADKNYAAGTVSNLTVSGTFAANGGTTLGDAIGDALTINSGAVSVPNGLNFDSNTFVIDATNNRIGVGVAAPTVALDVLGAVNGSSDASFNGVKVGSAGIGGNTVVGNSALNSNVGALNTALGAQTLYSNTSGGSNVAGGYQALYSNINGDFNSALGRAALFSNTSGSYNNAIGLYALYSNTTGSGNTGISPYTAAGSNSPVFAPTNQTNRFCMGSTAVTNAYIQVAWTVVSDARDKTDFAPVPHGLDFVNKLNPIAYRYKETRDATEGHGPVRYGFKAQDVLALEGDKPVIVDAEDSEKLRFNDQSMIAVLVNAVKELTAEVNNLKAKLPK